MGSHFASKAMGACSREPRAKIFAKGEIPVRVTKNKKEHKTACKISGEITNWFATTLRN